MRLCLVAAGISALVAIPASILGVMLWWFAWGFREPFPDRPRYMGTLAHCDGRVALFIDPKTGLYRWVPIEECRQLWTGPPGQVAYGRKVR